jgi:hypothetical protein
MAYASLIPLYLLFIARLRSPVARPLGGPVASVMLWIGVVGAAALVVVRGDLFVANLVPIDDGRWIEEYGILGDLLPLAHGILPLYGLLVAWDQWRRSRGAGVARRQATSYLLAFGWRDLNWVVVLLVVLPLLGSYDAGQTPAWIVAIMGLTELVFVALLGYAVLSTQLFDIDLKVKWTLKRSTLIAALAAAFFLAKEGMEALLPVQGVVPSIGGAGLVGLLALPAWRFANRLVDRAMPRVQDTPEYRQERKNAIYRAALMGALDDGSITDKERGMLAALAAELGLDPGVVHRLEQAIVAVAPGAAGL